MRNEHLAKLTKEELMDLIEIYSKNWLAHDGVWFQSIERKHGMDEAVFHDEEAWKSLLPLSGVLGLAARKVLLSLPGKSTDFPVRPLRS